MGANEKKLISNRVHFTSLEEFLEEVMPRARFESLQSRMNFTQPGGYESLREILHGFGSRLLDAIERDLEQGAARGIQEALKLIKSSDYYEVKKKRRSREAQRWQDRQAEQKAKRERWARGEYTEEEREQFIAQTKRDVTFYERQLAVARDRLLKLKFSTPIVDIEWPEDLFDVGDKE